MRKYRALFNISRLSVFNQFGPYDPISAVGPILLDLMQERIKMILFIGLGCPLCDGKNIRNLHLPAIPITVIHSGENIANPII